MTAMNDEPGTSSMTLVERSAVRSWTRDRNEIVGRCGRDQSCDPSLCTPDASLRRGSPAVSYHFLPENSSSSMKRYSFIRGAFAALAPVLASMPREGELQVTAARKFLRKKKRAGRAYACGLASCHAQNVCRVYLRRLPYVSLACCRRSAIFSIWLKNWWPDLFCIVHRVTLLASSQVKDTDKPVAGHSPAHAVRALRREASG